MMLGAIPLQPGKPSDVENQTMTNLRTALLASLMLCGTVTVAVAQAVADPQDTHHPDGTPDAATAPSDVPPLVDVPMPEGARDDAPGGSGMMVMMTPEMMEMMMGMMADQCMMGGGPQEMSPSAGHGEPGPARDRMIPGADMSGTGTCGKPTVCGIGISADAPVSAEADDPR